MENLKKKIEVESTNYKPVIKCPGGKGRLLSHILNNFPSNFPNMDMFVEPFVGGGAVFFKVASENLNNKSLVINDLNPDLVNVYESIRDDLDGLIERLNYFHLSNNKEDFNNIRSEFNQRKGQGSGQAARFLYLNKVGYNGLIRYNRKGEFNVPFGTYSNPKIFDEEVLRSVHSLFNKRKTVTIYNRDFSSIIWNSLYSIDDPAKLLFYLDPPYDIINGTSKFAEYTSQGFTKADHMRLKRDLDLVNKKGAKFLLSSSDTYFIRDLFSSYTIVEIKAGRSINSKKEKRGKITELLIKNY